MKIFEYGRDSDPEIIAALAPPEGSSQEDIERAVREIVADVRNRGDEALLELGQKYDSPNLTSLKVADIEFDAAYEKVDPKTLRAIRRAKANIEDFHRKQMRESWIDVTESRTLGQIIRPLERVGLYAPGGKAIYPSSTLMTAVPAKVAGVPHVVMCSPAQMNGEIDPLMLVAAKESGVESVYKAGGAQAIAAMAFGAGVVPRVDKVVGPGNAFVAEAKRQLYGTVGIDVMAGPSEIAIVADESADPHHVAADMLSQAEHAEDSRTVLVATSRKLADAALAEVRRMTQSSPRKELISQSLATNGVVVIVGTVEEAAEIVNIFAPEHLELLVADPWGTLPLIKNAGAIMLGTYSPVPLGDYAAGPSHTLPTGGASRFSSAVNVDDFLKKSSLIAYSKPALQEIAEVVIDLAEAEGFYAHANSIRVRLNKT